MPSEESLKKDPPEIQISSESEMERLRKDVFRSDMEKFYLFTATLRRDALLKKAKIAHNIRWICLTTNCCDFGPR